MSKRFTDTEKWDRPWFRSLKNHYKLLWCFVLDKCDIAGVWYVDLEMATFQIGSKFDRKEAENVFQKQIEVNGDRWLLKDFISFQYGSLEASNKIYKNVTAKLLSFKEGAYMTHPSPIDGVMVMDKEKDKDISSFSLKPLATVIPDDLICSEPEIKDWLDYKKQKGQTYKSKGLDALWRMFRSIHPSKRREAVDFSMSNNWAGLFEKKENQNGKQGTYGKRIAEDMEHERTDSKFSGIVKTYRVPGSEEGKN